MTWQQHLRAALMRRMADQPEDVQALLQARLQALDLTMPMRAAQSQPPEAAAPAPRPCPPAAGGLRSALRFEQTWTQVAAEQQVRHAAARAPTNAGPLNSHHLVLRTLQRMQHLSPTYLHGFMAQMETLLWLDAVQARTALPAKSRQAKPRRQP